MTKLSSECLADWALEKIGRKLYVLLDKYYLINFDCAVSQELCIVCTGYKKKHVKGFSTVALVCVHCCICLDTRRHL